MNTSGPQKSFEQITKRKMLLLSLTLVLSIGISSPALAMSGSTKGGYVACLQKEWLDDVIKFVVAKDEDSLQAYLDTKKCIMIKGGLKVTVTDSPGMFGGTAGFIYQGVKFWTVREALDYGE